MCTTKVLYACVLSSLLGTCPSHDILNSFLLGPSIHCHWCTHCELNHILLLHIEVCLFTALHSSQYNNAGLTTFIWGPFKPSGTWWWITLNQLVSTLPRYSNPIYSVFVKPLYCLLIAPKYENGHSFVRVFFFPLNFDHIFLTIGTTELSLHIFCLFSCSFQTFNSNASLCFTVWRINMPSANMKTKELHPRYLSRCCP